MTPARWLLQNRLRDVRKLGPADFRDWLRERVRRWSGDPVFAQRVRLRELRRSYPGLSAAEKAYRQAQQRDRAAASFERLRKVEESLRGTAKALAGLAAAGRLAKLRLFEARQRELEEQRRELIAASPQRQALLAASERLEALRVESGLAEQEGKLTWLLRESGRGSGQRGRAFERATVEYCEAELAPRLQGTRLMSRVTFGAPDTEFDVLVLKVSGDHATVLAAVEAKRNPNDLAHGYCLRRRNLAWLAGGGELQPTGRYPSGRFDRPFRQDGLVFTRESFQNVQLSLVSRPAWVWGLSSAALSRLSHRVASDPAFGWDAAYTEELRHWTLRMAGALETPDLLRRPGLSLLLLDAPRA